MNTLETLKNEGIIITETMTRPKKQGKQPRKVWNVTGRLQGIEHILYDLGATRYRKNCFSFWEGDPSEDIAREITEQGRKSFSETKELERERALKREEKYKTYSENAEIRARERFNTAHKISSYIPMGQPIMVDHHSEKRHRRDLKRMDYNMEKGIEELNKRDYYSQKAIGIDYRENGKRFNPSYLQNRINENEAELRRLEREKIHYSDYESRVNEIAERLNYFKGELKKVQDEMKQEGKTVPSPETVKKGDFVELRKSGYYEVIRVNRKSVTIKGWLGIDSITWKPPYSDITDIRKRGV